MHPGGKTGTKPQPLVIHINCGFTACAVLHTACTQMVLPQTWGRIPLPLRLAQYCLTQGLANAGDL
eukprot:2423693-Rhodomonas_salina.1